MGRFTVYHPVQITSGSVPPWPSGCDPLVNLDETVRVNAIIFGSDPDLTSFNLGERYM